MVIEQGWCNRSGRSGFGLTNIQALPIFKYLEQSFTKQPLINPCMYESLSQQSSFSATSMEYLVKTTIGLIVGLTRVCLMNSPLSFREESGIPPVPHHPNESFKFPKRSFGKMKIVEWSFQPSWFVKWLFLHYDEVADRVFCHTCMKAFKEVYQEGRSSICKFCISV